MITREAALREMKIKADIESMMSPTVKSIVRYINATIEAALEDTFDASACKETLDEQQLALIDLVGCEELK